MSSSTDPPFGSTFRPWTLSVMEHGYWKTWLNSMSPERLAQQRAYDRERGKQYHQDHKEERNNKYKEWYQQNKERLGEKHVCETCGGRYITKKRAHHCNTKLHQAALANIRPTCFKCETCGGRYTPQNKARHLTCKKHQHALQYTSHQAQT